MSEEESRGAERERVDRRGFLRLAGTVGGGFAAMSVLAACRGGGGANTSSSSSSGAATPAAAAASSSGGATPSAPDTSGAKLTKPEQGNAGGPPIVFRGWNYHP